MDQNNTTDQQGDADQPRRIDGALGEAHPAELVEQQRGEHLTGDKESQERDAVLRGEVAVTANELAAVGLPLPVLRPESGVVTEPVAVLTV